MQVKKYTYFSRFYKIYLHNIRNICIIMQSKAEESSGLSGWMQVMKQAVTVPDYDYITLAWAGVLLYDKKQYVYEEQMQRGKTASERRIR